MSSNLFDTLSDIQEDGRFSMADNVGKLALFAPLERIDEFPTQFGDKEALRSDVTIIDSESEGTDYEDALILQGSVIGKLKKKVGGKVLAVIGRGEAKKGKQAPYILKPTTTEQEEMAVRYLMKGAFANSESKAPADDDPFAA